MIGRSFQCTLVRVVDADTIDVLIDLGFYVHTKQRLRLARVNAPEMSTHEGQEAARQLHALLSAAPLLRITTFKTEKYGRFLAEMYFEGHNVGEINVNDWLLENGLAVPYAG